MRIAQKSVIEQMDAAARIKETDTMLKRIDQLTKERDELKAEVEHYRKSNDIQGRKFSEEYEKVQQLTVQLKEQSRHIRCIYCNAKYTAEQSDELADHILSCEKSPLVQMLKEMDSRIIDRMDMVSDEFQRILAITDNQEIIGICERAQQVIEQKEPVIKQRDDALDKLRLFESQVVQLLDENNGLKLDYSHSEAENTILAAKCAEMRHALKLSIGFYSRFQFLLKRLYKTMPHPLAWNNEDMAVVGRVEDAISLKRPKEITHAISDQCGQGWLSPEKAGRLRAALEAATCTCEHIHPDGHYDYCARYRAQQALEGCK